jgi:hypothetical protein
VRSSFNLAYAESTDQGGSAYEGAAAGLREASISVAAAADRLFRYSSAYV